VSGPAADGRHDRVRLVAGALAVAALFLALNLHYTGGEVVLPLDDSYIYAQYARGFAEGHPFRYTPGDQPSSGATGLLYPLLLAPFWLLGFRGAALPALMYALNGLLLAVSATLTYELAGGARRRARARLAAWLVVLSGPLAWGYLSGMEIGLFTALWLAVGVALLREGEEGRDRWSVGWASLLTLVRPEGLVWAVFLWLVLPFTEKRRGGARRTRLRWAIPILVGLAPLAIDLAITGSPVPAAGRPKSPLYLPGHHLPTLLVHAVGYVVTVVKTLLTGTGGPEIAGTLNRVDLWGLVAPFTLAFLVIGAGTVLVRLPRQRRVTGASLAAAWLLIETAFVALSTGSSAHHFRYLLPVWPALMLLVARGAALIAVLFDRERSPVSSRTVLRTFGAYLGGYGLLTVASFAVLHGQEAHGFARQYLDTARWIDANLPEDARIASLDAGILGYAGHRRFFDLFGLTTPSMLATTAFFAADAGSKFEVMERLPAADRPTHFVLHDRRHDSGDRNDYAALIPRDAGGHPRILHAAGVVVDVPVVGDNLLVWPADWSGAGEGDRPGGPVAGRVVDRVDLADPLSEAGHDLRFVAEAPGFIGDNRIDRLVTPDGRPVTDGGRSFAGELTLTLRGLDRGKGLTLRLRTLPPPVPVDLRVLVDGDPVGTWTLSSAGGRGWLEAEAVVPPERVRGRELRFTLQGRFLGYHLWALQ